LGIRRITQSFCHKTILSFPILMAIQQSMAQVTIVQIPTIGGTQAEARALNNNGAVVGFSSTAVSGEQHAFLFTGTTSDLGTLGGRISRAWDLNDAGDVVGDSTLSTGVQRAFLYRNGQMMNLGTLGGARSLALGVNNLGQVTGGSLNAANQFHAFLWANGQMQDLGTLGGIRSDAVALNDAGEVIGDARLADGSTHAFLYTGGVMVDLGTLGGTESLATAVNASGVVVGDSLTADGESHAFVYSNGQIQDVGTLGGTFSMAVDVNDAGQMIGDATTAGDLDTRGFLYHNGAMTDLGSLGSGFSSTWDINNRGQVVGYSFDGDGNMRAFLWENGVMVDLNTLLAPDSGWVLFGATHINEVGQVVGIGVLNGVFTRFLLNTEESNHDPVANAGQDISVECPGVVVLDASASSDEDGDALSYEWSENGVALGSGVTLPVNFATGVHNVHLVVTDSHGASAEDDVVVTVADVTAPVFTCPEPVVLAAGEDCQALLPDFLANLTATDNCPGDLVGTQTPSAGTVLGLGTHTVTLSVSDVVGNHSECSFVVHVKDLQAPVIVSVSATPNVLRPANRAMVPVQVHVEAHDNCDSAPVSRIVSITSSDPVIGPGDNTAPDFEITGPLTAELRAERSAKGARVYTLTVECTDAAGNVSTGEVSVVVPKGKDDGSGEETLKATQRKIAAARRSIIGQSHALGSASFVRY
jgi:probable HAF family extracellular repeat protein